MSEESGGGGLGRYAGIAGAAVGVAVAGAAVGILANRRRKAADPEPPAPALGMLRGQQRTVVADDGLALHAEVDEPAGGARGRPTVVLVHGYALTLDAWHFQRAALRAEHRLVLYDQRSHGRSGRSKPEHATFDQLGRDLACVIEQLGDGGPVVLVGHSMGGITILELAAQRPELFGPVVVGVALVATISEAYTMENLGLTGSAARLLHRMAPPLVATMARTPRLIESGRRASSGVALVLTKRLAFGGPVPDEYVDFVDQMLAATPFEVVADFFPNFSLVDNIEALRTLDTVDTVIVCGTNDAITPVDNSRRMAEWVPGARLVEVEGAGHMVPIESHAEVTEAIEDLLAAVEAHG